MIIAVARLLIKVIVKTFLIFAISCSLSLYQKFLTNEKFKFKPKYRVLKESERNDSVSAPVRSPWQRLVWSPKIGRIDDMAGLDDNIGGIYLATSTGSNLKN